MQMEIIAGNGCWLERGSECIPALPMTIWEVWAPVRSNSGDYIRGDVTAEIGGNSALVTGRSYPE